MKAQTKQTLKKTLAALYIATIGGMAAATLIEKEHGTLYAARHVYGSWWFTALWALLAAAAIAWFIGRRVRRASTVALHLSLAVILAGALITRVSSVQGIVHLRLGETTDKYMTLDGDSVKEWPLPFSLSLKSFETKYYEGTTAPSDYVTRFVITDGNATSEACVSMNNIHSHNGVRFYQNDYDRDMRGSILSINADPWGIATTYTGYALLLFSLLWMLADPKGGFRRTLSSPLLRRGALAVAVMAAPALSRAAAPTLPEKTAAILGEMHILYNNRVCPLQTFAIDFTKKIYGSASYKGLTAEQVLTGWLFWSEEWAGEPFIRLKKGDLRSTLQLPEYVSMQTFFNSDMGGYILGPYVEEYYHGNRDAFHRQAADIDDKLMLIMQLRRGMLLKVFPHTDSNGTTQWYAPADRLPAGLDSGQTAFITKVFALIEDETAAGNTAEVERIADKIRQYQASRAGSSLPSETQTKAERIYNRVPFATTLFVVNLTAGLLALAATLRRLSRRQTTDSPTRPRRNVPKAVAAAVMAQSFAALTACLALRWVISGNIPMSNGYETMLLVAWLVMLLSLISCRRFAIVLPFGLLMSGLFLLVSHINQMDPAITNIMPVLNSPLLSVHVSLVMLAFALLSLTFICGLTALAVDKASGRGTPAAGGHGGEDACRQLMLLSRMMLYPALAALAAGIFIGAVWANISWGRYWSWDAKETWALITLMVYAIGAHSDSLPSLRRPARYHLFMVLAFLTILMTYFGVNYFLGSGMHTYA